MSTRSSQRVCAEKPNLLWPGCVIRCHPHLRGAQLRDRLWQQAYRKTINQERMLESEAKHMTVQTHGGLAREGGRDRQKQRRDRGTEIIQVTQLLIRRHQCITLSGSVRPSANQIQALTKSFRLNQLILPTHRLEMLICMIRLRLNTKTSRTEPTCTVFQIINGKPVSM